MHKCCGKHKDHEIELVQFEENQEQVDDLPDRMIHPENYDSAANTESENITKNVVQPQAEPKRNDYCSV